jgi:hypothetical protein
MKFNPPINKRTTEELLEIMESADDWNPDAVDLSLAELIHRKIPLNEIKNSSFIGSKKKELEKQRKANLSYKISDFIIPWPIFSYSNYGAFFDILFSLNLKKDGYYRKAKQQKYFRLTLGVIILIVILINKILE